MNCVAHSRSRSRSRSVAAAVIGNALEWFDFIIYALLASAIFKLFFPAGDPMISLLIGFGTFGVAFLVRPIGGLVLGVYADRYGRKNALSLAFIVMAIATGMVAILPTYSMIGLAAPILLITCRILQGFSAGGEFGNATAVLIEFAPAGRKGLFGSLQMCSQALAVLIAAGVVFSLSKGLSAESFESWGWRVPFLVGALLCPLGLIVRNRMSESPEFKSAAAGAKSKDAAPLTILARHHRRQILASIAMFAAVTVPNYVNSVYMPSVAVLKHGISQADAMLGVVMAATLMAILVPSFGWLSDKISRPRIAVAGMFGTLVLNTFLFTLFLERPGVSTYLLLQGGYVVPYAAFVGATCTLALERFPVLVRATGSGIGYNLATMVFSGLTPFWLALLAASAGAPRAPSVYVAAVMVVGIIGVHMIKNIGVEDGS